MPYPLFGKDTDHVGWVDANQYIFDVGMNWVGFLSEGYAWSAKSLNSLGPVSGLTLCDAFGHPVAWNPTDPVVGVLSPIRHPKVARIPAPPHPIKLATPARPARALTPNGGWSKLSFVEWLMQ